MPPPRRSTLPKAVAACLSSHLCFGLLFERRGLPAAIGAHAGHNLAVVAVQAAPIVLQGSSYSRWYAPLTWGTIYAVYIWRWLQKSALLDQSLHESRSRKSSCRSHERPYLSMPRPSYTRCSRSPTTMPIMMPTLIVQFFMRTILRANADVRRKLLTLRLHCDAA